METGKMSLTRAEVETWVAYHKDWPDTMAYKVGAALLAAWDALGAVIECEQATTFPNEGVIAMCRAALPRVECCPTPDAPGLHGLNLCYTLPRTEGET